MENTSNFKNLQKKIKTLLAKSLRKRELKPRDLLLILTIFKKAENYDELHMLVELFKEDYPQFLELLDEEKYTLKENFEDTVQNFISKIVMDNPLLAAEISRSALEKGTTIESLKQKFPEFKNFSEK